MVHWKSKENRFFLGPPPRPQDSTAPSTLPQHSPFPQNPPLIRSILPNTPHTSAAPPYTLAPAPLNSLLSHILHLTLVAPTHTSAATIHTQFRSPYTHSYIRSPYTHTSTASTHIQYICSPYTHFCKPLHTPP